MIIRSVKHKGLRRLLSDDDGSAFSPAVAEKLRHMLSFLQDMHIPDELYALPSWRAHQLSGKRKGVWSLTVTRNWRLTFALHHTEIEIIDLDYEDYH